MNYKPYFKFLPQTFKSCFEKVVISLEVHLGQLIFALQAKSAPWAAVCRSLVYIGKKKFETFSSIYNYKKFRIDQYI